MKRCSRCRKPKPLTEYGRDASRPDGLSYWCRDCRNTRSRDKYTPHPLDGKPGPAPADPRDGDKEQARQRVNVEVRTGYRPHPNTLPCTDCGHVWVDGERRHEYDHHLGYKAEHHGDVEAVCTTCHRERTTARGELVQVRNERGRYAPAGR